MPIHDWTKTYAGAFHHFHVTWLSEIAKALNSGVLPEGYYALGEQVIGGAVPDVLTLERRDAMPPDAPPLAPDSLGAAPLPSATITAVAEHPRYPPRPRVIAVRHVSRDRLVAMIEIVSAGNKSDAAEIGSLIEKTLVALSKGVHVLLVDLHGPGAYDPDGLHNLIWKELGQDTMSLPSGKPLQVASYLSARRVQCFLEPLAVGDMLPSAPLFLTSALHVRVPLESTHAVAFAAVPEHLRRQVEG
jgi:hypothetical protein